jgi:glycosyltransferase involved in cell wall biosynthesis
MSGKITLGIIGDAGCATGFATVTHNLAGYLQDTGKYDVHLLAINFDGRTNEWSRKFDMWPARTGGDFLGVGLTPEFVETHKPDTMLVFHDFWNIPIFIGRMPPDQPGVVSYYPVDAPNIKSNFLVAMARCTALVTYTNFGAEESARAATLAWENVKSQAISNNFHVIGGSNVDVTGGFDPITRTPYAAKQVPITAQALKKYGKVESYNVIPHGVDLTSFFPMSKKASKKHLGLPPSKFVVGYVARNQSRKRQDLTIRGFSEFAKDKDDVLLVLHGTRDDPNGWDLRQLAEYYGMSSKLILTHENYESQVASIEELNHIYNAMDVSVNTGGGEGWGLPPMESAATRTAQVMPNWSATKEIWEGSGELIDVISVRHEPSKINTEQAVIDTHHFATILSELYEDRNKLDTIAEQCYQVSQKQEYKWENVGKKFEEVFEQNAGTLPPVIDMALDQQGVLELKKQRQEKQQGGQKHAKTKNRGG